MKERMLSKPQARFIEALRLNEKQNRLRNDLIRDLIVDVRCAERGNSQHDLSEYVIKCREQLRFLIPNRHGARLNSYGWPEDMPK